MKDVDEIIVGVKAWHMGTIPSLPGRSENQA